MNSRNLRIVSYPSCAQNLVKRSSRVSSNFSQVNRKSQTIFHLDDSDSDDDPDLANQSLSQSMMRSNGMLGYSKSFQVNRRIGLGRRPKMRESNLHNKESMHPR